MLLSPFLVKQDFSLRELSISDYKNTKTITDSCINRRKFRPVHDIDGLWTVYRGISGACLSA